VYRGNVSRGMRAFARTRGAEAGGLLKIVGVPIGMFKNDFRAFIA
jgi:hypothetical protein